MKYINLHKKYIAEVHQKFKKQYGINLGVGSKNIYIRLKYMYNNYVGAFFVFMSIKLNLSANFITFSNAALGLIGLLIFTLNLESYKFIAMLIFFSKNILDNVDGFVARFKKETSEFGDKLDFYSALVYYYAVIISFSLNNYYKSFDNYIIISLILIIVLDVFNPIRIKKFKTKLIKVKKNIYKKTLYKIFRFSNYDGRTVITDFMLLIMIVEIFLNIQFLSKFLLSLFLLFKFLRNSFYIYKRLTLK